MQTKTHAGSGVGFVKQRAVVGTKSKDKNPSIQAENLKGLGQ